MRLLFIHQNMPGQFRHLLQHFASDPNHQVIAAGEQTRLEANRANTPQGVRLFGYGSPHQPDSHTHPYLRSTASAVLRGQAVVKILLALKKQDLLPT